jgi:hypothetical protein
LGSNPIATVKSLSALYHDVAGGIDPESDPVIPDVEHGDGNVLADHQRLRAPSGQDEHGSLR